MTWIIMDMIGGPGKKATFLGGINGMICGLVGITPAAGYVNGVGAIIIGLVCSAIVWFAWNFLSKVPPFSKVDDALGVVYTHGIAGLVGGLLVGLLADPSMIVYLGLGKNPNVTTAGLFYGHAHQLLVQAGAALTVIVWDGLVTFLILKGIGLFMKLRIPDADLEIGDVAVHGEEAYPAEELALVGAGAPAEPPEPAGPASPDGRAVPADKVPQTEP
jgi:Amt family ammonium transporter